jgi:hypothetical protein
LSTLFLIFFIFHFLVDNLLLKGTLDNFCQVITEDLKEPIENLDLADVVGIVTLFFTSIAQPFQGLNIALAQQKQETLTKAK